MGQLFTQINARNTIRSESLNSNRREKSVWGDQMLFSKKNLFGNPLKKF